MSHPAVPQQKVCSAVPPDSAFAWTPFSCTLESCVPGKALIRVIGELDLATVPQLERTLSDAAAIASRIVLDLHEVSFMDSSGLHLILEATRRQREAGGGLVIGRGQQQVERLFALTEPPNSSKSST